MAGRRQKDPALLVNQRGGRARKFEVIPADGERLVPPAPAEIGDHARSVWLSFWGSWVSSAVQWEAHAERLRHWIRCVDERDRLWPLVVREPLITSAKGRPMVNPLVQRIRELTRDIERAEEHYGMTPLSSWRMQLTASEASRSANDLRRELLEAPAPRSRAKVIDLNELA